jgi:hypothetical protein
MSKICSVCDQPVSGNGVKVKAAGKDVTVCCNGCADALKANPDKYLKARQKSASK